MLKVRIRSTGILGVVGLTLVTVSHPIPIAMGYELLLAYIAAVQTLLYLDLRARKERLTLETLRTDLQASAS